LPDVNVRLALAIDGHPHRRSAQAWLDAPPTGSLAFCRVTGMGLLRLLTNRQVMQHDTLGSAGA
jgi:predicted nucleic acid-binding protein